MLNTKTSISIFWFRRDLRLEDNHGLFEALQHSPSVLPIFIFDKDILDQLQNKHDKRVDLIHQILESLQKQLVQIGSSLMVMHNTPENAFLQLLNDFDIKAVYTNHDYEPYAIQRDQKIETLLQQHQIKLHSFKDQVMYEKDDILKADKTPYTIFTPYSRPWKDKINQEGIINYPSEKLSNHFLKISPLPFPSLNQIGFEKTNFNFSKPMPNLDIISQYHLTRNLPYLQGTTQMSVHLRFGTISIRALVKVALELNEQWLNELIWREFFMMILYHFPQVVKNSFKSKYDHIQWRNDEIEFQAWCNGETGFPIVDAGMRELNETGLMHNRVRMIVASFLTKDLLIDWRWGEAYFAEKLLDYDLSANNGNWQWAAGCGCDAAPYFRIFNPMEQTKKFDPSGIYLKRWIKDFDHYLIAPIVDHNQARKRCLDVYKLGIGQRLD